MTTPDFRPRCCKCKQKWIPPEGVNTQVIPCPSCRKDIQNTNIHLVSEPRDMIETINTLSSEPISEFQKVIRTAHQQLQLATQRLAEIHKQLPDCDLNRGIKEFIKQDSGVLDHLHEWAEALDCDIVEISNQLTEEEVALILTIDRVPPRETPKFHPIWQNVIDRKIVNENGFLGFGLGFTVLGFAVQDYLIKIKKEPEVDGASESIYQVYKQAISQAPKIKTKQN